VTVGPLSGQRIAQAEGAAVGLAQLDLDARHVGVSRDYVQAGHRGLDGGLINRATVDDDVVDCDPACFTWNTQTRGGIALRIHVYDQHLLADRGQGGAEVDRRRGLAHAALLVRDGEDAGLTGW
jgi:ABC-type phosphonate transport system ATPase subunit